MQIKRLLAMSAVLALAVSMTACGKDEDKTTDTGFSEQISESVYTPEVITEQSTSSTATTTATTATTTAKTTTKATTAATKSSVSLSSGSGSQLMSVRKAFEQDGKIYITGVYLKEGEQIVDDEDGEVYVDLPTEKDGKSHTFILSSSASIAFSDDYGPDTKSISAKDFVSKFNAINDGSGVNYTASISGSTVSSLKFFYIP